MNENPGVTYQDYDGTTLPVPDASFDLTFAIGVLHHVPVRLRASFLDEARRATAPGGLVVVLEHNPLNPLTRLAVQRCDFDEDVILPSRGLTTRLFRRSRLSVVEEPYVLFVPWRFPGSDAIERGLRWLPLGAQYVVAGRPDAGVEPTLGRADRG